MISVSIVAVHGIIRDSVDFVASLNTVVKECLESSNAFKEIFLDAVLEMTLAFIQKQFEENWSLTS